MTEAAAKKKLTLTTKVLIGLAAGLVLAFILQTMPDWQLSIGSLLITWEFIKDTLIIGGLLWIIAELFLNAIWLVVIPLIFVSLFVGVAGVADATRIGRMGGKVVAFYLCTTALAVGLAMLFSYLLNPAGNVDMSAVVYVAPTINEAPPVLDVLIGIVPRNIFAALNAGNTLQIIFAAIFLGLAAVWVGEKAKPVTSFMESLNEIVLKMVEAIMKLAPYGIFALIARSFSQLAFDAILAVIAFVLVVWLTLIVHAIVVYGSAIKLLVRKDPVTGKKVRVTTVFKKLIPALTFAFASASSAATLPVTMRCADNLGVNRRVSSFALPLGVTINMDGTAIFQGVAAIFLANVLNIHLGFGEVLTILITAVLASIGSAGVPGAGMIMLSIVLTQVGIPIEAIGIIFGIDRIVDMPRTVINIFGDVVCSMVVANSEGEINWEQFNSEAPSVLA